MAFGFDLKNSSGVSLLSTDWHVLKFIGKSPENLTTYKAITRHKSLLCYIINAVSPICSSSTIPMFFYSMTENKTISMGTFYYAIDRWHIEFTSTEYYTPEFYWFSNDIIDNSTQSYGLRIFSEMEEVTFDSGWDRDAILKLSVVKNINSAIGTMLTVENCQKPAVSFYSCYNRTTFYGSAGGGYSYYNILTKGLLRTNKNTFKVVEVLNGYFISNKYPLEKMISDNTTATIPFIDASIYD